VSLQLCSVDVIGVFTLWSPPESGPALIVLWGDVAGGQCSQLEGGLYFDLIDRLAVLLDVLVCCLGFCCALGPIEKTSLGAVAPPCWTLGSLFGEESETAAELYGQTRSRVESCSKSKQTTFIYAGFCHCI